MTFLEHSIYLTETKEYPSRIGYGIRDTKTHQPIKFFGNLHFYQDLTKFKQDKENSQKLNSKEWQITNEKEFEGKRTFNFWGNESKEFPAKQDEMIPTQFNKKHT